MATTDPIRDLSRTAAAIDEYDRLDEEWRKLGPDSTYREWAILAKATEDAGRAVGRAFGEETSDRNSVRTCEQCVRPGPKVPPPGSELSFVRKIVAEWKARSGGKA